MEIRFRKRLPVDNKYFLIDLSRNELEKYYERIYEVASYISIYHNNKIKYHIIDFDQKLIEKYWRWDNFPPHFSQIGSKLKISKIQWYIKNKITINKVDNWSSDFLHGVSKCGTLNYYKREFAAFHWRGHNTLINLLKTSNFMGKFNSFAIKCPVLGMRKWYNVAAFLLKYSEDSKDFMAGVLSTGEICYGFLDGRSFLYQYHAKCFLGYNNVDRLAKYSISIEEYFNKWGIPIEFKTKQNIFISPIWAALFVNYMPSICKNKWLNIKKPYLSDIYCPVLWRTYVNKDYIPNGIPYLKSKRMLFYIHKCEEGAITKLEMLRVSKGLTMLDNRFKEIVQEWNFIKEPKVV